MRTMYDQIQFASPTVSFSDLSSPRGILAVVMCMAWVIVGFGPSSVAAQSVTSIHPRDGTKGTPVSIWGAGFSASPSENTVMFGGVEATIDSASQNVIYTHVPPGVEGPVTVSVQTDGVEASSSTQFTGVTRGKNVFASINAGLDKVTSAAVAWGDFDGNSDVDIALAGFSTSAGQPVTKIYRNQGDGSFSPIGAGLVGVDDATLDWGDYDSDDDLDLVISGFNGTNIITKVYRNDGSGNFTPINAGIVGGGSSVRWGDYNSDGKLDLAIAGQAGIGDPVAKVYVNEGNDSFSPIDAGLTGVSEASVAWGDYDGDGDLDLAVAGITAGARETTTIYRNASDGNFVKSGIDVQAAANGFVLWRDFDQDGDLDLTVSGSPEGGGKRTTIYRNEGDGTFSTVDSNLDLFRGYSKGASGAWGDHDADGDLDLAVAGERTTFDGRNTAAAEILQNDGEGSFTLIRRGITEVEESALGWADYDSDGDLDLLVTGENDAEGTAKIYRNEAIRGRHLLSVTSLRPESGAEGTRVRVRGAGFATTPGGNEVSFGGREVTVDSATANVLYVRVPPGVEGPTPVSVSARGMTSSSQVEFTGVTGGGADFQEIETDLTGIAEASVEWGDFDADGDLDLATAGRISSGGKITRIYRNEDGTFSPVDANLPGFAFGASLSWGDFDSDGDLDLAVAGEPPTKGTRIYENEGDGNFKEVKDGQGVKFTSTEWGDYDGDGKLDLLVSGRRDLGVPVTQIYRNEGDGTFRELGGGSINIAEGTATWGDYDGDGNLDLLTVGNAVGKEKIAEVSRYENGRFRSEETSLEGVSSASAEWRDHDADGDLDLAITGSLGRRSAAHIYRNSDSSFEKVEAGLQGLKEGALRWGDFDADGDPDLILIGTDGGEDRKALLYRNTGSSSFESIDAGITGLSKASVDWGDYDADGDLDLVVAGRDSGQNERIIIYENRGSLKPAPPEQLVASSAEESVSLSWNARRSTDVATYRVYRNTAPIDSLAGPSALTALDMSAAPANSYTDMSVETGRTYYYRVTAVDSAGSESAFSSEASTFLYPSEVTVSASRTFGGATDATGYRLVALPGQADRPMTDAVSGEAGSQWQAYHDDGSANDYLVEFDGSDTFTFQKGNGFWLTATSEWNFDQSISTVELRGDSAATIGLRDGWNVISNPTGKDVSWSRVNAANPDTLQAIFGFDGAFAVADTFRTAASGVAYYFFNDDSSRDSLVIPYPGAPGIDKSPRKSAEEAPMLALTAAPAEGKGAQGSTVRLGISAGAARGVGAEDLIAPPGRFTATSLRIEAPTEASGLKQSARTEYLMVEKRPPVEGNAEKSSGHTFQLRLTSRAEDPVTLSAKNLSAIEGRSVALFHPAEGTTYDLREEQAVTIEPSGEPVALKVAVGSEAYVEGQRSDVVPAKVRLTSYPNPMSQQGTVEYALPEETDVTLRVYDVLGREVATLAKGRKAAGRHTVHLSTDRLSSGVYLARLQAGRQTRTLKITVVR